MATRRVDAVLSHLRPDPFTVVLDMDETLMHAEVAQTDGS